MFKLQQNYIWILIQFICFLIISYFSINTYGYYILNKSVLMGSIITYIFFWTFSIFVFSWKKNQVSTNTSVIYRFWRRALVLFWGIESFTFSVFVYCLLNAPNEIFYVLDNSGLWHNKDYLSQSWFITFSLVISSILLAVFMLLFVTNYNLMVLFFLLSHLVLFFLIKEEYSDLLVLYNVFFEKQLVLNVIYKLYDVTEQPYVDHETNFTELGNSFKSIHHNINPNHPWEVLNVNWDTEMEKNKLRTYSHCIFAIGVLKWAHVLFIYGYFLTVTYFSLSLRKHSVGLISGHIYNLGFLSVFYLLYFISLIKYQLNLSYSSSYAWCWENLNIFFFSFTQFFLYVNFLLFDLSFFFKSYILI